MEFYEFVGVALSMVLARGLARSSARRRSVPSRARFALRHELLPPRILLLERAQSFRVAFAQVEGPGAGLA